MIAFHFPPQRGSSGIQRTLKFSRYLGSHGWKPVVLSAHPRAYEHNGEDQLRDIPEDIVVQRAFALDSARHLAVKRRYLSLLALPDRWISWALGAIPSGLGLIRKHRPDVIWSTYPIPTAHLIGLALHRLTGLPWVADMRDPMIDDGYPTRRSARAAHSWIEKQTLRHADRIVFTTPGALAAIRKRYPDVPSERLALIENGYDEESFSDAGKLAPPVAKDAGGPLLLIHSGVIYPSDRNPSEFFEALAHLVRDGRIGPETLQIRLRATAHDDWLNGLIAQYGIASIVSLAPQLSYRDALAEMLNADGLLVLQGSSCNCQIPAKIYEYLRARRPVLALTDPIGDTAATLRHAGIDTIGPLDERDGIMAALMDFVTRIRAGTAPLPSDEVVRANSREARAARLARLLDKLLAENAAAEAEGVNAVD